MKKNKYIIEEELENGIFLLYNTFSNTFALQNSSKHNIWEKECSEIHDTDLELYNDLINKGFIIDDDLDEFETVRYRKNQMQQSSQLYHIMINTTLDCNLNCWYCYENKIVGSHLDITTKDAIKKNISVEYECERFSVLKVSFFGGEPFMDFNAIKEILDFSKSFCDKHAIDLIADFTTNATLITEDIVDYLKDFYCHFQITIDGNRKTHNKIKKNRLNPSEDSYSKTLETLKMIDSCISKRWVAVRINFDNMVLHHIEEILDDISFLDRKSTFIILKKVWQVSTEKVDKEALVNSMQMILNRKFVLDYYIMPKGSVCFAERRRMTLFNYDGKIFKCSTVAFDEKDTLGNLDKESGIVRWKTSKIVSWFKDILQEKCRQCKWFPVCLGPCNKQLIAHPDKEICTFDAMNLNFKEYLVYLFKCNLVKKEINVQS